MIDKNTSGFQARSRARRRALQALYQWRINPREIGEIIAEFMEEQDFSNVDSTLFRALCQGVTSQHQGLDEELEKHLDRPIEHLDVMARVILQIGLFEILHQDDTPAPVIIDECVDLAHRFGAELGHTFINGVLDKAARSARPAEKFTGKSS